MTEETSGVLPKLSESQRIGQLAKRCFSANHPNPWLLHDTDGDDDFGFDYQVQVSVGGSITDIFRAQLKGTTVPDLSADGTYFSVTLKASTIRYYNRTADPTLLILCDLSVDEDHPKNCPVYYVWAQDEIRRIELSSIGLDQDSVTLRVPKLNQLDEKTDLSADLKRFRELASVGTDLSLIARTAFPDMSPTDQTSLVSKIPGFFLEKSSALLDVILHDSSAPWPEAPVGSLPWQLQEAASKLRIGAEDDAEVLLEAASKKLADAKEAEIAEYWLVMGRLYSFRMNDFAARDSFSKAAEISKDQPRYVVPWAESELRKRHRLDEPNDFSDVIARIPGRDPSSLSIRARLIAAEGRYDEALEIAQTTPGVDGYVAQAIIQMMQSHFDGAVAASNIGLDQPQVRDSSKQLFLILRARAKFALAIGDEFRGSKFTLPISGPTGTNIPLLHSAWLDVVAAIESLRSAGWPSNVEFIADVWSAAASMLGRHKDALPFLMEAGRARPTLQNLQEALESIAVVCDKFDVALEANERQPDSETKTLKRVCLLHIAKQDGDCVNLFATAEHAASISNPMFGPTLMLAILSADRVVRPDLAGTWEARLDASSELAPQRALLDYFRETSRNLLARDVALSRLEERYHALGRPIQIAMHLFDRLDATDPEHADKCIELAAILQREAMLPAEGALHLAHALFTRGNWQDLLDLSQEVLRRFDRHDRFLALKAFALDKLGQSSEALATLRDMIDTGRGDSVALRTYINIVARSGFTAEAIKSVERILSTETTKHKKIEYLKMLFNLTQISDPTSQRCVDIAWEIGQLADQEVEEEEGIFLMLMCTATLSGTVQLVVGRQQEVQRRSEEFTRRFPTSKIFRRLDFPNDLSPEELMRIIQQAIGPSEEQRKWRERLRNQLERGQIAVPYAWRPKSFLSGVPDLPMLWEIGKQARSDQRQFHLVMALPEWRPVPRSKIRGHVPLLDMTTLLVIHDLELFDVIFRFFPKIAVGQVTLLELQHYLSPIYGSPVRQKCIEIQLKLKAHFEQIIQPTAELHENENVLADQASEEVKVLAREGRFMVYSDDAFFRSYCDSPAEAPPSICTLDVLSALEEVGELSPPEVASKIAMLCKWNVGVVILFRYMKAVLPEELASARSVLDGIAVLQSSSLCYAMFSGIWNPGKPYAELQTLAGAFLRDLCDETNNRIESVAALMGLWFSKAKLHEKSPQPPLRCIALLIIQAAVVEGPPSSETSHRLWSVLLSLVEIEYGDRMDVAKEREAIALTGRIAAECDKEKSLEGDKSLQQRLAAGLTNETAESDAFSMGYTQFHLKQVKKP